MKVLGGVKILCSFPAHNRNILQNEKRILALRVSLLTGEVFCEHFNHQEMKIFGVEYDFRGGTP